MGQDNHFLFISQNNNTHLLSTLVWLLNILLLTSLQKLRHPRESWSSPFECYLGGDPLLLIIKIIINNGFCLPFLSFIVHDMGFYSYNYCRHRVQDHRTPAVMGHGWRRLLWVGWASSRCLFNIQLMGYCAPHIHAWSLIVYLQPFCFWTYLFDSGFPITITTIWSKWKPIVVMAPYAYIKPK